MHLALAKGYKILETYEVWHFDQTAEYGFTNDYHKGLFGCYVDALLKIKQEASGGHKMLQLTMKKDRFLMKYKEKEGIILEKEKVKHNSGLRMVAKLMLNSFWSKFRQRENLPQTEYITEM